jgi:hypothetical protein
MFGIASLSLHQFLNGELLCEPNRRERIAADLRSCLGKGVPSNAPVSFSAGAFSPMLGKSAKLPQRTVIEN